MAYIHKHRGHNIWTDLLPFALVIRRMHCTETMMATCDLVWTLHMILTTTNCVSVAPPSTLREPKLTMAMMLSCQHRKKTSIKPLPTRQQQKWQQKRQRVCIMVSNMVNITSTNYCTMWQQKQQQQQQQWQPWTTQHSCFWFTRRPWGTHKTFTRIPQGAHAQGLI